MRSFKVKTKVIKNFNDTKTGKTFEENEPITLDRDRYEELFSKGYVAKGEEVREEKEKKFEFKNSKKEEEE